MASRTSAGIGMTISLTVFIVLTMTFLVASVYLYSEKSNAEGEVLELTKDYEEVIKTGERNASNVQGALEAARADGRKSLVTHLLDTNAELNRIAFGSPTLTVEQSRDRADGLTGGSGSLAATISRLEGEVQGLMAERDSANARLASTLADLEGEFERIREIDAAAQATADEATAEINEYAGQVDQIRNQAEAFEDRTNRAVRDDRRQYQSDLRDRDQRIAELNQDILVLRDQVRRLRGETTDNRVTPLDEYALVDGEVAAVQPGDSVVVITLGREDKLVIGMTFSVFDTASAIRPNEMGNYLPGKAVIEVISMEESSARCRVIRSSRGNPVGVGDVIANPVYDPDKVYNFVVFGNFDVDNDGVATPFERDQLVAIIERWGGEVIDDISGDLDFLVLGRRPEDPLQPAPNAPRVVYDEYLRLKNRVDRYEELFAAASASSIPVLNENRLSTLIGELPR